MNSLIEDELAGNQDLRDQLMDILSNEDLAYKLPGNNPTLGELCVEMGMTQQIYSQSFRTFKQDWRYQGSRPDNPNSVASINAWFKTLDAELESALSTLSEDAIQKRQIDRGHGFNPSPYVHFQIYREALLIFYAKASVYLKALEKPLSEQWQSWVG